MYVIWLISPLCYGEVMYTELEGGSLTAFSAFELTWKGLQDKLFIKATKSIRRRNCSISSTKVYLMPPATQESLPVFAYYPGLSDSSQPDGKKWQKYAPQVSSLAQVLMIFPGYPAVAFNTYNPCLSLKCKVKIFLKFVCFH